MIHPRYAPIAYATVMGSGWFEGLALTAHAQFLRRRPLDRRRYRCRGDGPWVGKGRLDV